MTMCIQNFKNANLTFMGKLFYFIAHILYLVWLRKKSKCGPNCHNHQKNFCNIKNFVRKQKENVSVNMYKKYLFISV